MRTFISIDSATSLGWAVWDLECVAELVGPIAVGCVIPKAKSWDDRVWEACARLASVLSSYKPGIAVCEYPRFFDSEGGSKSAKQGDLVKLSFACGAIAHQCSDHGCVVQLVPVNDWKQMLSKAEVERRIKSRLQGKLGGLKVRSHGWDAVGIGLWKKGYLLWSGT